MPADDLILANARMLDGNGFAGASESWLRIADGVIAEISGKPISSKAARTIDLKGRTLMPGLIDCHVHVTAITVDPGRTAMLPDVTVAFGAARIMKQMLMRGFTTVRDVGGATRPLAQAEEAGHIEGPRLVFCGKALSQTGGHSDYRGFVDNRSAESQTYRLGAMGRVCDGVDAVRHAARDEIRQGAQFIKAMANGGVSSPTDPINFQQFSIPELEAIVEEAANAQTYVSAHLYTDEAISRAVRCGVRSVEHANLIEPATARLMKVRGAIACPTLVAYEALHKDAKALGLPDVSLAKNDDVRLRSRGSLEILQRAGVTMAFGTDLLGELHKYQSDEFTIRAEVLPPIEVIRSTTCYAAELLRMTGKVGSLQVGVFADLIAVDGDPLENMSLLGGQGDHLSLIVRAGRVVKNTIDDNGCPE
ncbi:amidohydrolase family protein [Mesorhizobium captivum]|uniref:metal-dependent hydrolase family protein n=1 Tax=Mesorhizobium captivum TaxID=3072319 RepID=UPI003D3222D5